MKPTDRAKALLEKYKTDELSEEEKVIVEQWLFSYQEAGIDLSEDRMDTLQKEVWEKIQVRKINKKLPWLRMVAAACLLLGLGAGLLFFMGKAGHKQQQIAGVMKNDLLPGGNKAMLTLAGGKKISLTDASPGKLAIQSGISISKSDDGQLVYEISEEVVQVTGEINYNTIETPRGGQFQVNLPDGSRVWLNAATVIRFPLSFRDLKERRVELKGEAYFEIEKDVQKPFVVQSDGQLIKVLGTQFNVSSYVDEPSIKTTLLEGSIKLEMLNSHGKDSRILKPGQQARTSSEANEIRVLSVDVQAETSWKNGFFSFEDMPIELIMKQISRWYDVDVIYKDNLAGKTVWGSITRYTNVSKVLSILEKTGKIHFRMEGRRIYVSK